MIRVIISKLSGNLEPTTTLQFGQDLSNIKLILAPFKNELFVLEKLSLTKAADKDEFEFNIATEICLYNAQGESKFNCAFLSSETKVKTLQNCKKN